MYLLNKYCYSSLALFPLYTLFVPPPPSLPPQFCPRYYCRPKRNWRQCFLIYVCFFFLGVRAKYNTCSKPCLTYISCTWTWNSYQCARLTLFSFSLLFFSNKAAWSSLLAIKGFLSAFLWMLQCSSVYAALWSISFFVSDSKCIDTRDGKWKRQAKHWKEKSSKESSETEG